MMFNKKSLNLEEFINVVFDKNDPFSPTKKSQLTLQVQAQAQRRQMNHQGINNIVVMFKMEQSEQLEVNESNISKDGNLDNVVQ